MAMFECVPNFSEGRDPAVIEAIVAPARAHPGVTLLDVESDPAHHRCVVTLVGDGDALIDTVLAMMRVATDRIDLNVHEGEHPRMGATDVVPFVPLGDETMAHATLLAERLAARVWEELAVPVYLYGEAARVPERRDLARVREGQFEGLRDSIASRPPDVGDARVHPTAGVVAIGARPVLIAYNAYLTTPDVSVAKRVAKAVRARDGGLAEVKALGFDVEGRAQVSMNLTDYRRTPVHRVLDAVRREAARYGVAVAESEVVGVVPEDALFDAAEAYLQLNAFDRSTILERKVRAVAEPAPSLAAFCATLAARTPTPGGGSAAAAAGALGAALAEMVLAYSGEDLAAAAAAFTDARGEFLALVHEDAAAYDAVRAARKQARDGGEAAEQVWVDAVCHAADVPMQTARLASACSERLAELRPRVKATVTSDLVTSLALLRAARDGALANVTINLEDLRSHGVATDSLEAEVARLAPA